MDELVVALFQAEMKFKDKWLACISLGEQTFRTHVSDQLSTCFYRQFLGIELCLQQSSQYIHTDKTCILYINKIIGEFTSATSCSPQLHLGVGFAYAICSVC